MISDDVTIKKDQYHLNLEDLLFGGIHFPGSNNGELRCFKSLT